MKVTKDIILEKAQKTGEVRTSDFVVPGGLSRQAIVGMISGLVESGQLLKIGSTRSARYITPEYLESHPDTIPERYAKTFVNKGLEEHVVLQEIEQNFFPYKTLPENIKSIFAFAFSEMLNNAIDHSQSESVSVMLDIADGQLEFLVEDSGIGVFRNIMKKRKLADEFEAIQDLLKGKVTTMPKLHSGEGIFFTSRIADSFELNSYGFRLRVDTKQDDVFVDQPVGKPKQGTRVTFRIDTSATRHLGDVFREYTNLDEESNYGFDKTEVRIKLYLESGVNISRSQARRVLSGLESFDIVVMDYAQVDMIGQAFADEIYRVFQNRHPDIEIQNENMSPSVKFMVERAKNEAKKRT